MKAGANILLKDNNGETATSCSRYLLFYFISEKLNFFKKGRKMATDYPILYPIAYNEFDRTSTLLYSENTPITTSTKKINICTKAFNKNK